MPGMAGFEVPERLNELAPRFGRIPVVFLSALADRDNQLKGRRLGAEDYVTKPIDFERLSSMPGWRASPATPCCKGWRSSMTARPKC